MIILKFIMHIKALPLLKRSSVLLLYFVTNDLFTEKKIS